MALYITGEGTPIVLFADMYNPTPILSSKYLADELAKTHQVIAVDYIGTGFSDTASSNRTVEQVAYEIHYALEQLEIQDYVLMAFDSGGAYCQYYVSLYPDEVRAVIGLDTQLYSMWNLTIAERGISQYEYSREISHEARLRRLSTKLINVTGIKVFIWELFASSIYATGYAEEEISNGVEHVPSLDIPYEQFFKQYYNADICNATSCEVANYNKIKDLKYPENIPVFDFVSNSKMKSYAGQGVDLLAEHRAICDSAIYDQYVFESVRRSILQNRNVICDRVDECLELL